MKLGRIIDGKVEYGKIIDFGVMPNATSKSVAHGIENGDKTYNVSIFCNNANGIFGGLVFPHIARHRTVYGNTNNKPKCIYFVQQRYV